MYSKEKIQLFKDCLDEIYNHSSFLVIGGTIINFFYFSMPTNTNDIDLIFSKKENNLIGYFKLMFLYLSLFFKLKQKGYYVYFKTKRSDRISRNVIKKERNEFVHKSYNFLETLKDFIYDLIIYKLFIKSKNEEICIDFCFLIKYSLMSSEIVESHQNIKKLGFCFKARTLSLKENIANTFAAAINRKKYKDLFYSFLFLKNNEITEDILKFVIIFLSCSHIYDFLHQFERKSFEENKKNYTTYIYDNFIFSIKECSEVLNNLQSNVKKILVNNYSKFYLGLLKGDLSYSYLFNIPNLENYSILNRIRKKFISFKKKNYQEYQKYCTQIFYNLNL